MYKVYGVLNSFTLIYTYGVLDSPTLGSNSASVKLSSDKSYDASPEFFSLLIYGCIGHLYDERK